PTTEPYTLSLHDALPIWPSLGEIFKPAAWEKIRIEGAKVLQRLLELPLPVVGVANGPATVHSEYLLLADIHIASERATYGDQPRSEEHTSELQSDQISYA